MTHPAGPPAQPLPYAEITADNYAATFAATSIGSPTRRGVLLRGECPRCGDDMEFPMVTEIFQHSTGAPPGAAPRLGQDQPMLCTCTAAHPDRPAGEEGCGAYWNISLSVEP
ncbi:hypothetical protein ABZS52_18330 [Micromonospora profundi]|uniref:hypothetical protein n=1 Tax=Micromonospora profundi TaxID=1420889 RepID=UPI00339F648A